MVQKSAADTSTASAAAAPEAAAGSGRLAGRRALVTGATSGIGRAIALAYAAEGATVAVAGRDAGRGAAAVEQIERAGGSATFVAADLTTVAAVRQLARDALAALGGSLDVLVNNAGVYPPTATETVDEPTFEQVIATNVRAPFFLVQALLPALEASRGTIVNVGSWGAAVGLPAGVLYAASKATLEQLTRGWAAELGPRGVRVNTVSPGITVTDGTAAIAPALEHVGRALPAGRLAQPHEIASAAVYLAGDESAYVHGATLLVDGGALSTRAI
ncbi:SDR family oxidoreductase [Conexibacter sp. JD483]|uniref:SDR family NAD(P)-dependent oxidoreductase n=1 Tax=unclassified Conexibacter TaxID=2627773 RepID=UPI0027206BD7|nr:MULTISPECIES: SDR family oxidoreductase [unclassified Conexibacter]MDO8187373.1 SDR family oxidoreductase [Conexibacter sp. CPCC 205706]MDO8200968.1 SDR family oxidoreductase [Conexibacter sp. CPCC 205762]MDR9371410.1 SDR family oxidoreductase [Conexibacter sp. JD483]